MKNFYLNGIFKSYKEEREKLKKPPLIFGGIILTWLVAEFIFSIFETNFLIKYLI